MLLFAILFDFEQLIFIHEYNLALVYVPFDHQ